MVNREQLKHGGRRAYEAGRLRMAARAVWVLAPLVLVCALGTGRLEACACVGLALLAVSVLLRWRNRRGVDAVRYGLVAGAFPLFFGVAGTCVAPDCANAPLLSVCTAASLGLGLPSGLWLGRRLARREASLSTWIAATGIAMLAASLGCIGLGVAGLTGTIVGLLIGTASTQAIVRSTP
jgi:hypothetical protein